MFSAILSISLQKSPQTKEKRENQMSIKDLLKMKEDSLKNEYRSFKMIPKTLSNFLLCIPQITNFQRDTKLVIKKLQSFEFQYLTCQQNKESLKMGKTKWFNFKHLNWKKKTRNRSLKNISELRAETNNN